MTPAHRATVVSEGALIGRAADLIDATASSIGRSTVVLHGGAVEAAEIALVLQERGLARLLHDGSVELVHRGGGDPALRSAARRAAQHGDGEPGLLVIHPLAPSATSLRHPCVCSSADEEPSGPGWASSVCLFDASYAASGGLTALFQHPMVDLDGIEVRLDREEGRLLAMDMLLEQLNDPATVHQLAVSPVVKKMTRAAVERLVERRLSMLPPARPPDTSSSAQPPPVEDCGSMCEALLATDGRLEEVLETAQVYFGGDMLLEDTRFVPVCWLPKAHRPPSLSELISAGRLSRLARKLRPGVAEQVRLGTPSAGTRLVVRIGSSEPLGYLSAAVPRSDDLMAGALTWLRHVTPLLAAEMSRRARWRRLRSDSRRQLVTLLVQGLLSPSSARVTLNHLVGPEGARVAALSAAATAANGPPYDPEFVVRRLDRLGIAHGEYQEMIVALLAEGDQAPRRLLEELASQPVAIGLGAVVHDPAELPDSARQAAWTCQIALSTRRRLLDFAGIGVHRLLLPGAAGGDPVFEEPIQRLDDCQDDLGFDGTTTLSGYLDSGGNMRRAAEQLAVHVNTLRYRLQRMSEVMGTDLADPEQRFRLQLALRLRAGRRGLQESGETDRRG